MVQSMGINLFLIKFPCKFVESTHDVLLSSKPKITRTRALVRRGFKVLNIISTKGYYAILLNIQPITFYYELFKSLFRVGCCYRRLIVHSLKAQSAVSEKSADKLSVDSLSYQLISTTRHISLHLYQLFVFPPVNMPRLWTKLVKKNNTTLNYIILPSSPFIHRTSMHITKYYY